MKGVGNEGGSLLAALEEANYFDTVFTKALGIATKRGVPETWTEMQKAFANLVPQLRKIDVIKAIEPYFKTLDGSLLINDAERDAASNRLSATVKASSSDSVLLTSSAGFSTRLVAGSSDEIAIALNLSMPSRSETFETAHTFQHTRHSYT